MEGIVREMMSGCSDFADSCPFAPQLSMDFQLTFVSAVTYDQKRVRDPLHSRFVPAATRVVRVFSGFFQLARVLTVCSAESPVFVFPCQIQ